MSNATDRAYELGFRTVDTKYADRQLSVEGTVPSWLPGALIRNEPGKFEFGGELPTHVSTAWQCSAATGSRTVPFRIRTGSCRPTRLTTRRPRPILTSR